MRADPRLAPPGPRSAGPRSALRAGARPALGAGAILAAAHAGPAVTALGGVRRVLLPRLAGTGRPDHVALTFDDGPDRNSTPAFLAALDRLGWRATFFMLGDMGDRDPGLALELAAAGHAISLHGYERVSLPRRATGRVGVF